MERRTAARERKINIIVGFTALGGLVGFVVLLMAFGYAPSFLRKQYTVKLYLDDVASLKENSRVTLWGREIGQVSEVGFSMPGEANRTYVKLTIEEEFDIPNDIKVRVETPIFGGGPVVAMVGSSLEAPAIAKDGTAVLASSKVIDLGMQIELVTEDISELKRTWVGVGDNINALFGGEGEGDASLSRVVVGLEDRLDELKRVFAQAEEWLGDEQLREDITQTAKNAKELTASLEESVAALEDRYLKLADAAEERLATVDKTLETATQTIDGAAASIGEIEKNYVALADDAAKVVSVIDKLVAKADTKDSTIGLLLSDPQLYHNLSDSAERIKLMTDEARLLIEKWKAEGLPIRVFN